MPEDGKITATVDVFAVDPHRRDDPTAPVKVRAIVWSGPDFRTPTIRRGAVFSDPVDGRHASDQFAEACRRIGIPVEVKGTSDEHEHVEPELPYGPAEGGEYARR